MRDRKKALLIAVVVVVAVGAYRRRPMRHHPDGSPCAFGEPWVTRTKMIDKHGRYAGRGFACHGCTQEWAPTEAASA